MTAPGYEQGVIIADDPATRAAHGELMDEEALPEQAGPRTADQMLAKAQVLATIGLSNQVAALVALLRDREPRP